MDRHSLFAFLRPFWKRGLLISVSVLLWLGLASGAQAQTSLPDLTMDAFSVPAKVRGFGSAVPLQFTIKNIGKVDAGGFFVVFYYSDAAKGSKRTFLAQKFFSILGAGKSTGNQSITVVLPDNVLFGKRYIHYYLDSTNQVLEIDKSNNRGSKDFEVTGKPNLQVLYLGASPQTQVRNGPLSVSYRVYNAGYSRLPARFFTRFYFSPDPLITTTDTYLNKEVEIKSLTAQQFLPGSFQTKVIPGASLGTNYIGAIVDYDKKIQEESENDNTQAFPINVFENPPTPDLLAVEIKPNVSVLQRGKSLTVSYKVTNQGNRITPAYTLNFYFSADPRITIQDQLLLSIQRPTIQVGQTYSASQTFVLRSNLPPATGYLGIFVDPVNKIKERDENNNTVAVAFRILADQDKDGFTNDKDCNDNDKTVYPGAKEICDGKDNDCDGQTDEGCPCQGAQTRACYGGPAGTLGTGTCKRGTQTCVRGNWGPCTGAVLPRQEQCDGKDDDCDGQTDENLFRNCYSGAPNTPGKGVCRKGFQVCANAKWSTCAGQVIPTPEQCDGKDNDCDGSIDEALTRKCYSAPPDTIGRGVCKQGQQSCAKGVWSACTGEVPPQKEICDGKDNDCDGRIDNQAGQTNALKRNCKATCGLEGDQSCSAGKWSICSTQSQCREATEEVAMEAVPEEMPSELGPDEMPMESSLSDNNDAGEPSAPDTGDASDRSEPAPPEEPSQPELPVDTTQPDEVSTPDEPAPIDQGKPDTGTPDQGQIDLGQPDQGQSTDTQSTDTQSGERTSDSDELPQLRATGGCGCQTSPPLAPLWWLLLLSGGILGLARRRRRSSL